MDGADVANSVGMSGDGALLGIYFTFGVGYADNVKKTHFYAVQGWCNVK